MIVGFTGTRHGMNSKQLNAFRSFLGTLDWPISEFHHGDCIGADQQANDIARSMDIKTAGHPPIKTSKRAYCKCDIWFTPKEYLARNADIVDVCDVLVVAPQTNVEINRSGTWSTYRDAKRIGRDIMMLKR